MLHICLTSEHKAWCSHLCCGCFVLAINLHGFLPSWHGFQADVGWFLQWVDQHQGNDALLLIVKLGYQEDAHIWYMMPGGERIN